jgi:hypothetical protein
MNSRTTKNKVRIGAGCFLICLAAGAGSLAIARGGNGFHGGGFRGGDFHGYGWSQGFHYPHYWGGFYIGPEWFWGPTVVIAGVPYYYYSGVYYTPYGDGLVAVTLPPAQPTVAPVPGDSTVAASAPANTSAKVEPKATQPSGDTVTINVPNASGGFTPVKLVKTDKGYVGPQGEFYPNHPTIAELKVFYGN